MYHDKNWKYHSLIVFQNFEKNHFYNKRRRRIHGSGICVEDECCEDECCAPRIRDNELC